jgi:hypothetical protein
MEAAALTLLSRGLAAEKQNFIEKSLTEITTH